MDRWETLSVTPEGGMVENLSPLVQGASLPGSLVDARNFEPSPIGGYRRIKGYEKFDTAIVPGTGQVDAVFMFQNKCLALRAKKWYVSTGSGWGSALITLTNTPVSVQSTRYNWSGTDNIIIVDGANPPIHYDGSTLTSMIAGQTVNSVSIVSSTAANILAATAVQEFHEHMFYSVGQAVRFSAPNAEGTVTGADGSGEIITGNKIIGMAPWREQLFLFAYDRIGTIAGQNSTNFQYQNVTHKIGTINPRTIQEMDGDVYYLSFDGIRTIAGTVKNQDFELGNVTRNIPSTVEKLGFRNSSKEVHATSLRDKSQYRLFVGDSTNEDSEGEGLLGGVRLNSQGNKNLEWFKIRGINASCSDSSQFTTTEYIVHGGFDGHVYRQEESTGFNGANIDAFLRFPYWTISDPEMQKTLYTGKFYLQASSVIEPSVGYNFDYNVQGVIQPPIQSLGTGESGFFFYGDPNSVYDTATFGDSFPVNADVNLVGSGNNVSFYFSSNDTRTEWTVQSITIEYSTDGRRG